MMPSTHPRINIVCDKSLHSAIAEIAEREGVSLSSMAQQLLLESLELREDIALSKIADRRAEDLDRSKALTIDEVFGSLLTK